MRKIIILLFALASSLASAGVTRQQQADTFISASGTYVWTLPTLTDTLTTNSATETLTNKTINASNNTLIGILSNPMTTANDVIYGGTSGTPTRLGIGTSGQVLTSNGSSTAPSWQTPGGSSSATDPHWLSNVGLTAVAATNALTVTLTQSNASSAPTSGSPVIFAAPSSFGNGTTNYSVTSTLAVTVPSGATLGLSVNSQPYFIWVYLINSSGTPDICVSGVNPVSNLGDIQFPTDIISNYFIGSTISSGSTTAGTLYCGSTTGGPGHLIGKLYVQAGALNTSGQWTASPNLVMLAPIPVRVYSGGTYANSSPYLGVGATSLITSSSGAYSFTVPSSSVTVGAVYSTGGSYFVASNTIASATALVMASMQGNVTPATTGTLTLVTGTGSSPIAYTARTISAPNASTAAGVVNNITFTRDGDIIDEWVNYYSTATLTSAAAGTGDYVFPFIFPLSGTAYTTGGGGILIGGTAQTTGEFGGVTANSQYKIEARGTCETTAAQVFTVTSAVPYTPAANYSGAIFNGMFRVLGQYMNTTTTLTASEVPLGSTYVPMGSNIGYNFHVKFVSALGIYGP
jgi:hypothetical protein